MQVPSPVLCKRVQVYVSCLAREHYILEDDLGYEYAHGQCPFPLCNTASTEEWNKHGRRGVEESTNFLTYSLAHSAESNEDNLTAGPCSQKSSCKLASLSKGMAAWY